MKHGVRNDNQKNNKIALPKHDLPFESGHCEASYFVHEDNGEANMFQRKIIEEFQRKRELPRKTKWMSLERKSLAD